MCRGPRAGSGAESRLGWPGQSVGGRARPGPGCQRALRAHWLAQVKPWPWPLWEVFDNSFQPHIPSELLLNLDFGLLGGSCRSFPNSQEGVYKLVPGRAVSAQGTRQAWLLVTRPTAPLRGCDSLWIPRHVLGREFCSPHLRGELGLGRQKAIQAGGPRRALGRKKTVPAVGRRVGASLD